MTTTDSNGILFLDLSDNISPFHTLMNSLQSATSTAVEKATRGPLYAANNTARDALLTQYGSSASNPLWVNTAGVLEIHNGTSWSVFQPALTYMTSTGAGGGGLTTTPSPASSSASVTLTPGTWQISGRLQFTLSTAANIAVSARFQTVGGTWLGSDTGRNVPSATQGGTSSFVAEWSRLVGIASTETVRILRWTSATGGTQSGGSEELYAVKIA